MHTLAATLGRHLCTLIPVPPAHDGVVDLDTTPDWQQSPRRNFQIAAAAVAIPSNESIFLAISALDLGNVIGVDDEGAVSGGFCPKTPTTKTLASYAHPDHFSSDFSLLLLRSLKCCSDVAEQGHCCSTGSTSRIVNSAGHSHYPSICVATLFS